MPDNDKKPTLSELNASIKKPSKSVPSLSDLNSGLKKKVPTNVPAENIPSEDLSQGALGSTLTSELAGSTSESEATPSALQNISNIGESFISGNKVSPEESIARARVKSEADQLREQAIAKPKDEYQKYLEDFNAKAQLGRYDFGATKPLSPEEFSASKDKVTRQELPKPFESIDEQLSAVKDVFVKAFTGQAQGEKEKPTGLNASIIKEAPLTKENMPEAVLGGGGIAVPNAKESQKYIDNLETSIDDSDKEYIQKAGDIFQSKYFKDAGTIADYEKDASKTMEDFRKTLPKEFSEFKKDKITHNASLLIEEKYQDRKASLDAEKEMADIEKKLGAKNFEELKRNKWEGALDVDFLTPYSGTKYDSLTQEENDKLIDRLRNQDIEKEGYITELRNKRIKGEEGYNKEISDYADQFYNDYEKLEKQLNSEINQLYKSGASEAEIKKVESQLEELRKQQGAIDDPVGYLFGNVTGKATQIYDPITGTYVNAQEASPAAIEFNNNVNSLALDLSRKNGVEDLKKIQSRYYSELMYLQSLAENKYKSIAESAKTGNLPNQAELIQAGMNPLLDKIPELKSKFLAVSKALDLNKSITDVKRNSLARLGESLVEGFGINLDTNEDYVRDYVSAIENKGGLVTEEEKSRAEQRFVDKAMETLGGSIPSMLAIMGTTMLTEGIGLVGVIEDGFALLSAASKGKKVQKLVKGFEKVASQALTRELQFQLAGEQGGAGEGVGAAMFEATGLEALLARSPLGIVFNTALKQTARATGETIEEYAGQLWAELKNDKSFNDAFGEVVGEDPLEKLALTYIAGAVFGAGKIGADFKSSKEAKEMANKILSSKSDSELVKEAQALAKAQEEGFNVVKGPVLEGKDFGVETKKTEAKKEGETVEITEETPVVGEITPEGEYVKKEDVKEEITPKEEVVETPVEGEQKVAESVQGEVKKEAPKTAAEKKKQIASDLLGNKEVSDAVKQYEGATQSMNDMANELGGFELVDENITKEVKEKQDKLQKIADDNNLTVSDLVNKYYELEEAAKPVTTKEAPIAESKPEVKEEPVPQPILAKRPTVDTGTTVSEKPLQYVQSQPYSTTLLEDAVESKQEDGSHLVVSTFNENGDRIDVQKYPEGDSRGYGEYTNSSGRTFVLSDKKAFDTKVNFIKNKADKYNQGKIVTTTEGVTDQELKARAEALSPMVKAETKESVKAKIKPKTKAEVKALITPKKKLAKSESVKEEVVSEAKKEEGKGPKVFKKQNAGEVDKLTAESKTARQKDALGTVKNIIKALGSISPDLEVLIHESEDSYISEFGNEAKGTSGALSSDGKIHLNLSGVNSNTALHEAAHVVMAAYVKSKPEAVAEFKKQLEGVLSESDLNSLNEFSRSYEADGKETMDDEFVTEALSRIANGTVNLDKTTLEKIKEIIRVIAKKLGLDPSKIKLTGKEDVIRFSEKLSEALKTGKELTTEEAGIKNATSKFQADYSNLESKVTFSYDKNKSEFKKLESEGYITRDKSLSDFDGQIMMLHQPDAAFAGTISKNGDVIVEGKGGVYYPIKFHEDGYFWASTSKMAEQMASDLNKAMEANGGKLLMALTTAPKDKSLSSTTASNAVMEMFIKKAEDPNFAITENQTKKALINSAKKVFGLEISKSESLDQARAKIAGKLSADNSVFKERKSFSIELITEIANTVKGSKKSTDQFVKFFTEGTQNENVFQQTKQGAKISATTLAEAISDMITEPILKEGKVQGESGRIYAVLEMEGKVEPIDSGKHESYPKAIKSAAGNKTTLHLLTDRQKWQDVVKDPATGEIVGQRKVVSERTGKEIPRHTQIMSPSAGISIKGLEVSSSSKRIRSTVTNQAETKIEGGKVKFQKSVKESKLFRDPNEDVSNIAKKYKEKFGIKESIVNKIYELDIENSKSIADAYESMKHDPNNEAVKKSYTALSKEVIDQYRALIDSGYKLELYEGKGEPYKDSESMLKDLRENKRLLTLSTTKDFGPKGLPKGAEAKNPMLAFSAFKDVNGKPLLINDIFRFVHDVFGHGEQGTSFGAIGEENAWNNHSSLFSDEARRALTTETRGQNSWVNFGDHMRNEDGSIKQKGDEGYLPASERPFAEQKNGLLPDSIVFPEKSAKFQKASEDVNETKSYIEKLNDAGFLSDTSSEEILADMQENGYDIDLETVESLRSEALGIKEEARPEEKKDIAEKKTPKTVMGRFIQSGLTEDEANKLAELSEKRPTGDVARMKVIKSIESEIGLDKAYELTSDPKNKSQFSEETRNYFAIAKANSLKLEASKSINEAERTKMINQAAQIMSELSLDTERAGQVNQFFNAIYNEFPEMRTKGSVVDTINKNTADHMNAPSNKEGSTVGEEIESIRASIESEIRAEIAKEVEILKQKIEDLKTKKPGAERKAKGQRQVNEALAEIKRLKNRKTPGGPAAVGIPGLSPEMVSAIAKLVSGYVNLGLGSAKQIVNKAFKDLSDAGVEITKEDIAKVAEKDPEFAKLSEEEQIEKLTKENIQLALEDFYVNGNSSKTTLASHLSDKLNLPLSQAKKLAESIDEKIFSKVEEIASSELDKNLKKSADLSEEEKAERKKQQRENNKLVNKISKTVMLGSLAGRDFNNAFAEKYGFPEITADQMNLLESLVNDAKRFEKSGQRELHQKTQRIINTELKNMKPKDAAFYGKLIMELAYLNALSGINTQGNANVGAVSTSLLHFTGKVLEQLLRGRLGAVSYGFRSMGKSLKAASASAKEARRFNYSRFTDHNSYMEGSTNQEMGHVESEVIKGFGHYLRKAKSAESLSESGKNLFKAIRSTILQYARMNFLLNASDAFLTTQFSEFNNAIAEYNSETKKYGFSGVIKNIVDRKDLIRTLDEKMGYDSKAEIEISVNKEIENENLRIDKEVDSLGLSDSEAAREKKRRRNMSISKGYKARRIQELITEKRDQEVYQNAVNTARDWIMLSDPDGVLGAMNEALKKGMSIDTSSNPSNLKVFGSTMLGLTIMFSRMTAKTMNAIMTSIPVIGLVPATFGMVKNKQGKWVGAIKPKYNMDLFKRRVLANMLMTTAAGAIFAEMFEWDDEDDEWKLDPNRLIDITYGTKGDEQSLKNGSYGVGIAFRSSTDEEFSSYRTLKYLPQALPAAAIIGNLADRSRGIGTAGQLKEFEKSDKSIASTFISGKALNLSISQMLEGSFNSIGKAVKNVSMSNSETMGEKLGEAAVNLVTSPLKTVTQPNFYRDLINESGGRGDSKKAYPKDFIGKLKYDYFGLDASAENKTDIFGNEYKTQSKYSQWANGDMNDNYNNPEWKLVLKYPDVKITPFKPKDLINIDGKSYQINDDDIISEYGEVQKTLLKKYMTQDDSYEKLNKLDSKRLQTRLTKIRDKSIEVAKKTIIKKYIEEQKVSRIK